MLIGVRHLSEKECQQGVLAAILGASAWVQVPRVVLALVPVNGDQPQPVAAFPFYSTPLAAPLSGDWVALCNSGCETLSIYSHEGKLLIQRPLRTGDSYPVVAEIPA